MHFSSSYCAGLAQSRRDGGVVGAAANLAQAANRPRRALASALPVGAWLACAIAAALSAGCKKTPTPTLSNPVALDTVDSPWLETSVGIDTIGQDRRIFVFGFSKGLSLQMADLTQSPAPVSSQGLPPANMANTTHWANDQLTVQLANGDVLLAWNGGSSVPDANLASTATWWNQWPTADGKAPPGYTAGSARDGFRPAILLWRWSSEQDAWDGGSLLDSAYAGGVGADGAVHADQCAQGVPWVAGFDRPELYADPWGVDPNDASKQRLYLTTACSRTDGDNSQQVFVSADSGKAWSGRLHLPQGHTVLTASASGRLFMLQYGADANGKNSPVLWWSDDKGGSLSAQTPADAPFAMSYRTEKESFPSDALQCAETGVGPAYVYPLAIAAAGPSAVFVAYPAVETVVVDQTPVRRQVLAVTLAIVTLNQEKPVPILVPVGVIRAKAPTGSVVMSSMITDSRAVGNPTTLLYWMETAGPPASPCTDPVQMTARYALLGVQAPMLGKPADLSDPAGFALHLPSPVDQKNWSFGDYMKGASYHDAAAKQLRFLPVWSQEDPGGSFGSPGAMRPHLRVVSIDAPPAAVAGDAIAKLAQSPQAKPAMRAKPVRGKIEMLEKDYERELRGMPGRQRY